MRVTLGYVGKIEAGILNLSLGKIYDLAQYLEVEAFDLLKQTTIEE